jgi:hypothetical protein
LCFGIGQQSLDYSARTDCCYARHNIIAFDATCEPPPAPCSGYGPCGWRVAIGDWILNAEQPLASVWHDNGWASRQSAG